MKTLSIAMLILGVINSQSQELVQYLFFGLAAEQEGSQGI